MADETATISDNTTEPTEQATTPTPAPTPASAPKPYAPSPASFAKKAVKRPAPAASASSYSDAEVKAAEAFGRVDDNGTVYVREGDSEREVGQFPDVSKEEALSLYARRYLDLKAKLDLLASRLHSDTVKSHEIDETLKSLEQETDKPAAVGDMAALKQQFEQLKEAGAAKKAELTKARKAAIAKAVEERTKIVEKAEALASSLDDEINWRSTADKFRSLFDQWQQHQRTSVHIDKPQADALWKRFSAARTTFNQARRKWSQARDVERAHAKAEKEAIIAEANQLKDSTAAEAFGRVDDNGTVYVREGDSEREVGQFPDVSKEEALSLYARRYLDLKAKLDLLASRLHSDTVKSHEIDETLKSLEQETDKPAAVGDMAALKQQFEQLKEAGAAKKAELTKARKAAIAKAVEERTKIVEKAEALASSLDDEINWRSTADKFRSLFDQWQQHQRTSVHIDKPQADALWKRFSAARTTFNQARRKWSQARDVERAHAKAEKEAIIAEANQLKDSTAWGETSRRFNELMDRWKRAGRVGRSDDDALWAQFRKAADEFFNARQADRDQISTSEKENLAKKEELLKKAEALVPVADEAAAKKARQALGAIQDEWDQIGYVPRDDMRRIEGRLDAVDKQIKAVEDAAWKKTDPEADARKSSFEEQLTAQLAELDEKIATESDPKKKAKLEAEKATKEQWLNAIK